ncbi:hypothetical protein KI387_020866, partial [Taxus chinensis]
MGGGRGSALNMLVVVAVVAAMAVVQVQAATYVVGGSQGWNIQIQKSPWAAGKIFKAGDVLGKPVLNPSIINSAIIL